MDIRPEGQPRAVAAGRVRDELRAWWRTFWFSAVPPDDLAMSRLVAYTVLVLAYVGRDVGEWGAVPQVFWAPVSLLAWAHLGPPATGVLHAVQMLWWGALVLAAVGLVTRISTAVAFVAGTYLLAVAQSYGKVYHYDTLAVITMGILALSRCGDAWSLDRLWARGARARSRAVLATAPPAQRSTSLARGADVALPPPPSAEYRWPVRLVWVAMVLAFASAGASKLGASGLAWAASDNMQLLLLRHHYTHRPPVEWGLALAEHRRVTQLLATGALALELASPLALVCRTARRLVIPGLALLQLMTWLLLGVAFVPYAAAYVFWVPWGQLIRHRPLARLAGHHREPPPPR